MTTGKIGLWKTLIVIVGFPLAYMLFSSSDIADALFARNDRSAYMPFWGGIMALHWISVLTVAVMLKTSGRGVSDIGFKLSRKGSLSLIALFAIIAFAALGVVETVLGSVDLAANELQHLPGLVPVTTEERIFFVLLVFSTGFCEEIVYRGFAITGLSDAGIHRWVGLFVAAFLFVGIHGVHAYSNRFVFLFGGGLMFGVLFLASRNLLPSIILHWLINLSAMFAILQAID